MVTAKAAVAAVVKVKKVKAVSEQKSKKRVRTPKLQPKVEQVEPCKQKERVKEYLPKLDEQVHYERDPKKVNGEVCRRLCKKLDVL